MALPDARDFLRELAAKWSADRVSTVGAALAYFTLFSLAPLVVLVIAIAGLLLGPAAAESEVLARLQDQLGAEPARVIRSMVTQVTSPRAGVVATLAGFAAMLLGATGALVQLQSALVEIWGAGERVAKGIRGVLRQRLVGLAVILGLGALVFASMMLTATLTALQDEIAERVPVLAVLARPTNFVVSLLLSAGVFAVLFRVLPGSYTPWRDLWVGGLVTALLFTIGQQAIGWYLGRARTSVYGAAGSLVLLILWIYYSAQILLAGAEFTVVWSRRRAAKAAGAV
jgi:membrane protein